MSELHWLSSLFEYFLFSEVVPEIFILYGYGWNDIVSYKAYFGVKRSWYWPKWASRFCMHLTRLQRLQQSLYEELISTHCRAWNKTKSIYFSYCYNKTKVQTFSRKRQIKDNKYVLYRYLFNIWLSAVAMRATLSEEIRLSLISVKAALCFIYWKYTFLFFKKTFFPFACRKWHKLLLIFSPVATSSRSIDKRAQSMPFDRENLNYTQRFPLSLQTYCDLHLQTLTGS